MASVPTLLSVASVPTRQVAAAQRATIFYYYIIDNQVFNLLFFAVANCRVETLATDATIFYYYIIDNQVFNLLFFTVANCRVETLATDAGIDILQKKSVELIGYFIISMDYSNDLKRIIHKSRQTLGVEVNVKSSYQKEIEILSKIL